MPKINEIVYVAPQKDWSFPLHKHENAAELSLITGGKGTFYCEGQSRSVCKGHLIAKNPDLSHSEKSDPDDPLEQICIEISGIQIDDLPENHVVTKDSDPVMDTAENFELLKSCFEFLMRSSQDERFDSACEKTLDLIISLIHTPSKTAGQAAVRKKNKQTQMEDVLKYLDERYREKIVIKDLAAHFFTSEGNLSRQFKKHTGWTINNYVVNKRMGEAQRLLVFSNDDIKDIAKSCGYDDLQYFYYVFKCYAHCTPVDFRKKYKGNQ